MPSGNPKVKDCTDAMVIWAPMSAQSRDKECGHGYHDSMSPARRIGNCQGMASDDVGPDRR
jgi:hypothetical protein